MVNISQSLRNKRKENAMFTFRTLETVDSIKYLFNKSQSGNVISKCSLFLLQAIR